MILPTPAISLRLSLPPVVYLRRCCHAPLMMLCPPFAACYVRARRLFTTPHHHGATTSPGASIRLRDDALILPRGEYERMSPMSSFHTRLTGTPVAPTTFVLCRYMFNGTAAFYATSHASHHHVTRRRHRGLPRQHFPRRRVFSRDGQLSRGTFMEERLRRIESGSEA